MAAIVAVLALAVTALAVTDDSDAAVDDTFTSGVYTCKILTETSSGGTVEISSNTASGSISIPSTVTSGGKTYNVTEIGYKAFENRTSLTSVTLPEGIGQLYSAFDGCTSLTTLNLPNTIIINGLSLYGMPLSAVKLKPDNPSYVIDGENLYNKAKTTLIRWSTGNILSTVNQLSAGAYASTDVVTASIPSGVSSIPSQAFMGCTSLTSVTIPSTVTTIEGNAFNGCSSLATITIPSSVTTISPNAFRGAGMTTVTIPSTVTSLGYYSFADCKSLLSLIFSAAVTSTGYGTFSGCTSLTAVTINSSITDIGDMSFYGCSALTSINIPSTVNAIKGCAFTFCSSLTAITLPNEITDVDLSSTSIMALTVPASVTTLKIANCKSLTSLTIYGTPRVGGSNSIGSCSNLVTLNMPAAIATYGDPLIATSWVGIHTITWADGSESGRQSYVMGTPVYRGTPGKTGHAFEGWQPALAPVTGDVTYTARFSAGTPTGETSHTITWIVGDTVTTTKCVTGSTPSYGANPIKAGSRFSGWSPTLMPATANAIYRAVFVPSDTPIPDPSVDRDGVADYVPYISLAAAVILTLIILIFYHPVLVIVDLALYVITAAGFMGWI